MFSFLLGQQETDFDWWWPLSLLSFLTVIMVYVVSLGYNSILSTEIIVSDKPFVFENYDDILSRINGVTPSFPEAVSDHEYFKRAPPDSKENRIWRAIQGRDIFLEYKNTDMGYLQNVTTEMVLQVRVVIVPEDLSQVILIIWCKSKMYLQENLEKPFFPHSFGWISHDPDSKHRILGPAIRTEVETRYPEFYKYLKTRALRFFESGTFRFAIYFTPRMFDFLSPQTDETEKCRGREFQMQEFTTQALPLTLFRGIFGIYVSACFISGLILMIEIHFKGLLLSALSVVHGHSGHNARRRLSLKFIRRV